jgi:hypothetical protein
LKIPDFALEVQPEGSQTCNVWSDDTIVAALKVRIDKIGANLQCANLLLDIPDVARLATFCEPLARLKTEFSNSFLDLKFAKKPPATSF